MKVLIGHGLCTIIAESSVHFKKKEIQKIVNRIAGKIKLKLIVVAQDTHLANNQSEKLKCGDNGIFKGVPLTEEEKKQLRNCNTIFILLRWKIYFSKQ